MEGVALKDLATLLTDVQLSPWRRRRVEKARYEDYVTALGSISPSIYVFDIHGGHVSVRSKADEIPVYAERVDKYYHMITGALRTAPTARPVTIAVDVDDEAGDQVEYPVFSFQKEVNGANILLPDFELHMLDYLRSAPHDAKPFHSKACRATFAGSTTGGGQLSLDDVEGARFPRLRAALYFKDHPLVDFRLPGIVQCETPEVEDRLRAMGFGQGRVSWDETFDAKFVISVDGNGATCSRMAIALASNCALLKYVQQYSLFYSPALIAGYHYIPVFEHQDVVRAIDHERAHPGYFEHVASAGTLFARDILSEAAVHTYVATLLTAFSDMIDGVDRTEDAGDTLSGTGGLSDHDKQSGHREASTLV